MDIETILKNINYDKKYLQEQLYDFTNDESFLNYLKYYYPGIYDFYKNCKFKYSELTNTVAVWVEKKEGVFLFINQKFLTQVKEICDDNIKNFYDILRDIIYHEELHYLLAHFRIPSEFVDHKLLNYAQDIVIDNFIYEIDSKWRNWKFLIDKINNEIDKKQDKVFSKISLNRTEKNYILNFTDLDIYYYLLNFCDKDELEKTNRIDQHTWTNETKQSGDNQKQNSKDDVKNKNQNGENKEQESDKQNSKSKKESNKDEREEDKNENGKVSPKNGKNESENKKENINESENEADFVYNQYEKIIEAMAASVRERIATNSNRILYSNYNSQSKVDQVIKRVADGREHNLFNILKKYIKKLSYKQRNYTWKKINKRQPLLKPGTVLKKQPGEVLLVLDTSGSMHDFINRHLNKVINEIYITFKKIAHIYGIPSKFYHIDSDNSVLSIKEIEKIEELNDFKLVLGGGTNFKPVFDTVLRDWSKKYSKNNQKIPDFILFITDLEVNTSFLEENKYAIFDNKLIWLFTNGNNFQYEKPPIGTVINVFANDWAVSIR